MLFYKPLILLPLMDKDFNFEALTRFQVLELDGINTEMSGESTLI